jgi:lipopolysaccharide transport system ATP-binding protein
MKPAIRVENLSKQYRIGRRRNSDEYQTLRETIIGAATAPFRQVREWLSPAVRAKQAAQQTHWALKDVSFEIEPGQVVGIIGRNGVGKSTLLKVLSRITEPTSGRVELRGRVGSLLEIGVGFHSELTGRENIYLNGAILGMTKQEIARKFDEIVAFAEVDQFLDTPAKRYSSGMYMRLAFAVAAHLDPEILLVDEVLAVGDFSFQKKCLGKMQEVGRQGRTVLFVSHNMAAILHLCQHAVVLSNGRVDYVGSATEGAKRYMESVAAGIGADVDLSSHTARRPGCVPLLTAVRLLDGNGSVRDRFQCGEPMTVEFTFDPVLPLAEPQFGIGVDDCMGARIFTLATYLSDCTLPQLKEPGKVLCHLEEIPLVPGRYSLSLSAGTYHNRFVDALDHAVSFEVEPNDFFRNGRIPSSTLGTVLVRSRWEKG